MAYKSSRRVDMGALFSAPFVALQWRLLLLWVLLLLVPTAVAALPLLQMLGHLLDHSTHVASWAQQVDALMFSDVFHVLGRRRGALHGAAVASLLLVLLLLPWLNGMVVASGRAGRALGFSALLEGGLYEYGRMFRLLLWSLLPYIAAFLLAQLCLDRADDHSDDVTLESQAMLAQHVAWSLSGLLVVLAQMWVESARAAFITDGGLRSATVAIGRGLMQLLCRPFSTSLVYLLLTGVGFALAAGIGLVRVNTLAVGTRGLLIGFLLSQLIVVVLGWMRIARVFALADVARSLGSGRRSGLA